MNIKDVLNEEVIYIKISKNFAGTLQANLSASRTKQVETKEYDKLSDEIKNKIYKLFKEKVEGIESEKDFREHLKKSKRPIKISLINGVFRLVDSGKTIEPNLTDYYSRQNSALRK